MNMEDEQADTGHAQLNERYIYEWPIIEIITNFLGVIFSSYFGGELFILFIALQFKINLYSYFSSPIVYVVPTVFFIIIMKLRKRTINYLINKANRDEAFGLLYGFHRLIFYIQLLLLAYYLIAVFLCEIGIITNGALLLLASLAILYVPIYFTFGTTTTLTEAGYIFIEFSELNRNIHSFSKRQRWLTKICIRVSDIFEKGNIMVNKDKLKYRFNLQMRNSVDIKSKINEMKNWFLSEDRNEDIFTIFEKIWPTVMKKPYSRLAWHQRIDAFLPYKYVKLLVVLIMFIIVAMQNPELIPDIIIKVISE